MVCTECPFTLPCYAARIYAYLCPRCGMCCIGLMGELHRAFDIEACARRPITQHMQQTFDARATQISHAALVCSYPDPISSQGKPMALLWCEKCCKEARQ